MADPAAEAAVIDASPLLHLARSGSLSLLAVLGPQWVIPAEVADEVRAKGETDRTVREIEAWAGFILPPPLEIPTEIKSRQLGRGESAVLSWALAHPGSVAILDDFKARSLAQELEIPLIGTLGIVVRAKRAGMLSVARPVIERLVDGGMYVSTPRPRFLRDEPRHPRSSTSGCRRLLLADAMSKQNCPLVSYMGSGLLINCGQ